MIILISITKSSTFSRGRIIGKAAAAILPFLCLGIASPAEAGTSTPMGCPLEYSYSYSGVASTAIAHQTVYGASGVTLSISETSGTTITGTVGGSGTVDVNAIVAGATAQVNASISLSKTSTVTRGGSWTVPSNQSTGWLADGAQANSMNWQYWRQNGNCTSTVVGSGSAKLPTLAPYIYHS